MKIVKVAFFSIVIGLLSVWNFSFTKSTSNSDLTLKAQAGIWDDVGEFFKDLADKCQYTITKICDDYNIVGNPELLRWERDPSGEYHPIIDPCDGSPALC